MIILNLLCTKPVVTHGWAASYPIPLHPTFPLARYPLSHHAFPRVPPWSACCHQYIHSLDPCYLTFYIIFKMGEEIHCSDEGWSSSMTEILIIPKWMWTLRVTMTSMWRLSKAGMDVVMMEWVMSEASSSGTEIPAWMLPRKKQHFTTSPESLPESFKHGWVHVAGQAGSSTCTPRAFLVPPAHWSDNGEDTSPYPYAVAHYADCFLQLIVRAFCRLRLIISSHSHCAILPMGL